MARRTIALITAGVATAGLVNYGLTAASAAPRYGGPGTFTFALKASPGIAKCLPKARGQAWITPGALNDTMKVQLWGMPANSDFDLFVIQLPNKPFGISWYQSDVNVGANGSGSVIVKGIFDAVVTALYRAYRDPLLTFVLRLTAREREHAEDVVQETMVRAWREVGRLDLSGPSLMPWPATDLAHFQVTVDGGQTLLTIGV